MSFRIVVAAPVATLIAALAATAPAASLDDPFATRDAVSPGPSRYAASALNCDARAPGAPLDLVTAVTIALCNNPQTHAAWAGALAQAAQLGEARSAYLPSLSVDAGYDRARTTGAGSGAAASNGGWSDTASVGGDFSWLLFDSGARAANVTAARELLVAANAAQDSTVQAVFNNAVQAYFQLRATQALLDAAQASERSSLESLQAAETRRQVGVATPADVLQARTAYSQATLARVRAGGLVSQARGTLATVLGLDADIELQLAPMRELPAKAGIDQRIEDLIDEARRRRPDLAAAEAQYRAAQADVDLARASGRPALSAGVTTRHLMPDGYPSSTAATLGLTFTVPLFNGFATTYRVATAKAQAELKGAERDQLKLQVAYDVWSSYQGVITATQSLQSSSDLLASATESEQVALGRYKAGAGTLLDLLAAQSALASARQARIQSVYDWSTSRVALALAMGELDTTTLQLLEATGGAPSSQPQEAPKP